MATSSSPPSRRPAGSGPWSNRASRRSDSSSFSWTGRASATCCASLPKMARPTSSGANRNYSGPGVDRPDDPPASTRRIALSPTLLEERPMLSPIWTWRAVMVAAMAGTPLTGASGATRAPISLDATLTPFLARYGLPALAAAVVKDGEIMAPGRVDIGGGRKIYLECRGSGAPTVVLIGGEAGSATAWTVADPTKPAPTVFSEVAKFTRVCAYDRPGTLVDVPGGKMGPSRSTPVPQPT